MGLFSSIGKAIGSVVGGITGGTAQAKAAGKAADVQAGLAREGIAEQRRQFDITNQNQQPWLDAGRLALGDQGDLLGLNGLDTQAMSIDALKASPMFQSRFNTGEEAILQNASATGGLRGGNIQNSLANFGSNTLAQVIQQQLGNLGGISGTGINTAQNLGSLGANSASQISALLNQQGAAQAGGILAKGSRDANAFNQSVQLASMFAGGGGF